LNGKFVRMGQVQGNAFNLDGHGLAFIMGHGGIAESAGLKTSWIGGQARRLSLERGPLCNSS
jgi:hypothetical protein